jgi:peptidoglycan/xylan/chitin deacetylase (PgdA/CDA1 family)
VEHYGIRTLLYGTLLPGPRIDVRAGGEMRAVRDAGFEVGVHCHDHIRWQDGVAHADAAWTRREFVRALEAFQGVFGTRAAAHAAAGWQLNARVLDLEQEFGLEYASDSRGTTPFWPTMAGVQGRCMQLPTTLPTIDELIGVQGMDAQAAAGQILHRSRTGATDTHVFTLHAELEGQKLLPQFEFLLRHWSDAGVQLASMRDYHRGLDAPAIARHELLWGEVAGRSGMLAVQGAKS